MTAATAGIPPACHPTGLFHLDYNGNCLDCGWAACPRLRAIRLCKVMQANMEDAAKSRERYLKRGKTWKAGNIATWIADEEQRLARLAAHAEATPCTCADHGPGGHVKPEQVTR